MSAEDYWTYERIAQAVIIAYRAGVRDALEDTVVTERTHINPGLSINAKVALLLPPNDTDPV